MKNSTALTSFIIFFIFNAIVISSVFAQEQKVTIRIGSKNFTESYVLAEILAQKIDATSWGRAERNFGMGGTGILYEAVKSKNIDVYPEYTGTISLAILNESRPLTESDLRTKVSKDGIYLSSPLGFNNSYGLAMRSKRAGELGISKISDLNKHPNLRYAFSYEFMERKDGFPALTALYNLSPKPIRMEHALVYTALAENKTDVVEVYTTDSKIAKYDLIVLKDDLNFFPRYDGVFLINAQKFGQAPQLKEILEEMKGAITDDTMIKLNGAVELEQKTFAEAAQEFLIGKNKTRVDEDGAAIKPASRIDVLIKRTKEHLILVLIPTLFAIFLGIPLGVSAAKVPRMGQMVLMVSGLIQTVPSLALLCFLIPWFGIGYMPATIALVLYGLLPIVRSTYSGLTSIEKRHHEVAQILGLSFWQKLRLIEIPLASVHILSGIKTAAIINVGMATLAAFIGAGGYGALIVTGLALNNNDIILQGALPAAGMALILHFVFEWSDYLIVPKGLRQ